MSILSRLFGAPPPATEPVPPPARREPRIAPGLADALRRSTASPLEGRARPSMALPVPPPGVRPDGQPVTLAMDSAGGYGVPGWATASGSLWNEGLWFPGYPYLADLAQRPEYRNIVETYAEEMTRKWIKLVAVGSADKAPKIKRLDAAMKRTGMREAFKRAIELDGFMGMGMLYMDLGAEGDEIAAPMPLKPQKIGKGSLRGFVPVDPLWVSPSNYNSTNPLRGDFYVPTEWYVMGIRVNADRLLIVRGREVPDMLKPSYNFGGLSLSQIAKPYVDNWLRTRQSVSDLLHAFTTFVLSTDMQRYLADSQSFIDRLNAFALGRDNKGLMAVDKETETLTNVSAPLGSLDKLQAQAQEQLASVTQIPLIKLLGVSPTGLNATAEGEIRVWYDRVKAKQEAAFGAHITRALHVLMLSEFGEVDEDIHFEFVPLWELDEAGRAAVEKIKADTDAVYMAGAVVSNEEVRARLADAPESPYHGLEGPAPEPQEVGEGDDPDDDDADKIANKGAEGSSAGANNGE